MPITIDLTKSLEITDPREQLEAVRRKWYAIRYIHDPSEEVKLEAVRRYGAALQYIHDPSEEVQLAALEQDPAAIQYFKRAWVYSNDD